MTLGEYLFTNCEREPLVKAFSYENDGTLHEVCSVSALPGGTEPASNHNPSGLSLSEDGKYLYVLVRGIDLVSVYKTDEATGALEMIQAYKLKGRGPRGCSLSPDGKHLAVANKLSDTVEVLAVNPDGTLSEHGAGGDGLRHRRADLHSAAVRRRGREQDQKIRGNFAYFYAYIVRHIGRGGDFVYRPDPPASELPGDRLPAGAVVHDYYRTGLSLHIRL